MRNFLSSHFFFLFTSCAYIVRGSSRKWKSFGNLGNQMEIMEIKEIYLFCTDFSAIAQIYTQFLEFGSFGTLVFTSKKLKISKKETQSWILSTLRSPLMICLFSYTSQYHRVCSALFLNFFFKKLFSWIFYKVWWVTLVASKL